MDKGSIEIGNINTRASTGVIRRLKSILDQHGIFHVIDAEEADFLSAFVFKFSPREGQLLPNLILGSSPLTSRLMLALCRAMTMTARKAASSTR